MNLLTIDFETFYSKQFSLTKLTTEEYIRDAQFETILVSVKRNDEPTVWFSGTESETRNWLQQFDWADSACLAHNTMFDGAILSWRYGIRPRLLLDTLCMGRALHGLEVGGSLKAMAERYQVGVKGTEVAAALGMRRDDFTPEQLAAYAGYCVNDVDLTYEIFNKMMDLGFPRNELLLIDTTLRMFTEPTLLLQEDKLRDHLKATRKQKEDLLASCEADKDTLMSNPKFATLLLSFGVEPPTKVSLRTGKEAYAFAKSDEAFAALAEHDDPRVQAVVSARLGTKSTLEETRTQRFLDMAQRGPIPIPLRYYGAHTGRWAGTDSINLQNLPSRGPNAGKIKKAMVAPPGHVVIDCDSSQIEARVLAWWAGQSDLVQSFRNGEDVYKKMAATIYGIPESDVDGPKRFIGKTTILGAGYGMGAVKFQAQLKTFGVSVDLDETKRIINVYRRANDQIAGLWRQAQNAILALSQGDAGMLGQHGVIALVPEHKALRLPSGLLMRYVDLRYSETDSGLEFHYKTRNGRTKIYGGKVVENCCQAIARCIIGEQMLRIAKRYKPVLTVHDAIAICAPSDEAFAAKEYVEECMRWTPAWAQGLPVNCESGMGASYGDC